MLAKSERVWYNKRVKNPGISRLSEPFVSYLSSGAAVRGTIAGDDWGSRGRGFKSRHSDQKGVPVARQALLFVCCTTGPTASCSMIRRRRSKPRSGFGRGPNFRRSNQIENIGRRASTRPSRRASLSFALCVLLIRNRWRRSPICGWCRRPAQSATGGRRPSRRRKYKKPGRIRAGASPWEKFELAKIDAGPNGFAGPAFWLDPAESCRVRSAFAGPPPRICRPRCGSCRWRG